MAVIEDVLYFIYMKLDFRKCKENHTLDMSYGIYIFFYFNVFMDCSDVESFLNKYP